MMTSALDSTLFPTLPAKAHSLGDGHTTARH